MPKTKPTSARAKSKAPAAANVVPLRAPRPGRIAVDRSVVRVVRPTAADLTPSLRALGAANGSDLDKMAYFAVAMEQGSRHGRRAGETDDAHRLRDRHYAALGFARRLVLELESLRPTADGADGATEQDLADLETVLASVEAARARWDAPKRPATAAKARDDAAPRILDATKAALEHAHRWGEQRRKSPPVDGYGVPEVDADFIAAEACLKAPELTRISRAEWERAIAAWPAERRGKGGDPKTRPTPWYVVVFDLLKPHGLTGASTAKGMKSTHEKAAKNRARPSRAKK